MGGLFVVIMRPRVGESDPLVINYYRELGTTAGAAFQIVALPLPCP